MPEIEVKCFVCGKPFLTKSIKGKYCSNLCRALAAKDKRKLWEKNTEYKAKQRERMREQRANEKDALNRCRQERRTRKSPWSPEELEANKQRWKERLVEEAKQGNLSSMSSLAFMEGDPLKGWRLYKEAILKSEEEFHRRGRHLVGEIEIHEEDFEYLVVEQIENEKRK
ncbi:hypothetical protein [Enterococcus thailandicus]|uniref:hypothetical protein n=1 Tax=Enterococcus thailandicus TaxID=417368 RepID=UPI0035D69E09